MSDKHQPMRSVHITFSDETKTSSEWPHNRCLPQVVTGRPDRIENVVVKLERISSDGIFYYREIAE